MHRLREQESSLSTVVSKMMTDVTCNGVVASWVVGACGERARHAESAARNANDDDETAKHYSILYRTAETPSNHLYLIA